MIANQIRESERLVDLCLQGSRSAQSKLYHQYCDAMFSICMRIMRNENDAQEVLQEAFISVFRNLNKYRGESTLGAWIKQIVTRACISSLRKNKRLVLIEDSAMLESEEEEMPCIDWNEEERGIVRVKNAISELAEGYRLVLSLYLIEGYDHSEIAQILNITESTSKSQYFRAKKKLQKLLVDD